MGVGGGDSYLMFSEMVIVGARMIQLCLRPLLLQFPTPFGKWKWQMAKEQKQRSIPSDPNTALNKPSRVGVMDGTSPDSYTPES